MRFRARAHKFSGPPLPGQMPLDLEVPAPIDHDPDGMTAADLARWLLARSANRTTRFERGFLLGIIMRGTADWLSFSDFNQLSDLHLRIGGRSLIADAETSATTQTGDENHE